MMKGVFTKMVLGLGLALFLVACNSGSSGNDFPDLDLLSYGVPLKIKAPEGVKVTVDDMGIVQDITVKNDGNYNLQIIAGTAYLNNKAEVVNKQKADAIASPTFSKIIEEDENGFIFEKKYSEERISYDFRYVRMQGDKEYIFQTGLLGQFTLEEVKKMYTAIQ